MANLILNVAVLMVVLMFVSSATQISAWWCTGHMMTAEIARQLLNPGVEAKINSAIGNLYNDGPFPLIPTMVPAACWADDLKSDGLTVMAGWHFINQPYVVGGFTPASAPVIQNDNVAANINSLESTLKRTPNKWETSFAVANLIHFIGDIHQPLHAAEMYSEKFPQGDRGGNLFHVYFNNTQWHLHLFWDSVCGRYPTEPARPPTQTSMAWFQKEAAWYLQNYKFTNTQINDYRAMDFASESLTDAKQYAYGSLQPGEKLSTEYVNQCLEVASKRITLAGYRIAAELNYVFSDNNKQMLEPEMLQKRVKQIVAQYGDKKSHSGRH